MTVCNVPFPPHPVPVIFVLHFFPLISEKRTNEKTETKWWLRIIQYYSVLPKYYSLLLLRFWRFVRAHSSTTGVKNRPLTYYFRLSIEPIIENIIYQSFFTCVLIDEYNLHVFICNAYLTKCILWLLRVINIFKTVRNVH